MPTDAGFTMLPDGRIVPNDAGVTTIFDANVAPADSGTATLDSGVALDAGDIFDRCDAMCSHLAACGADVGDSGECYNGCAGIYETLGIPGCMDLAYAALDCLTVLPCDQVAGRLPTATSCAPSISRYTTMCAPSE